MAFEKPEKKSKFKKCPNNKCKRETVFAICEHCGTYVGLAKLPKKKD